jgi:hypothetical protein
MEDCRAGLIHQTSLLSFCFMGIHEGVGLSRKVADKK